MFSKYKKEMFKNSVLLIFVTTITSLFITITGFIGPLLIRYFIDNYTIYENIVMPICIIFIAYIACYIFKICLNIIKSKFSISFKTRETCNLFRYMFKMNYKSLIQLEPTYLVEKINTSVNTFYQLYSDSIASYIVSVFTIIGCVSTIFFVNKIVGILLIAIIPINIIGYKLLNKKLQNICIHLQNVCAKNFADILSITSEIDFIKQSSDFKEIISFLSKKVKVIQKENSSVGQYSGFISLTLGDIINIIHNMIYIYVTILMIEGKFVLADYIFVTLVISMFFPALNSIVGAGINLRDIKGVYEFVENDIMKNIEDSGQYELNYVDNIEYEIHNIGYNDNVLIEEGKFVVKCGDVVMIQGESGCGKTTLMKGLVKFYDIEHIRLNNRDIREYSNDTVRNKIAFFSQNVPIITGTIRENILLGQKDSLNNISQLKNKKFMDKFFDLDDGLEHMIYENGSNLSGGDKQKIALARLYLENPDVIILDEITSSIDKKSSELIFEDIIENFKEKIVFVIAHDDNIRKYCNRVIKIENKKCREIK